MFACLYSLSTPLTALVALAESFTPRFEVTGPLVMLDVSGLSRLLGSSREIGDQLRRASPGPVRIAIAPTQTAAALLALSRAGLTVIDAGGQAAALAPLPVGVLGDLDRLNVVVDRARPPARVSHGPRLRLAATFDRAAASAAQGHGASAARRRDVGRAAVFRIDARAHVRSWRSRRTAVEDGRIRATRMRPG